MPMTKTEARELKTLVRSDFDTLEDRLSQRDKELHGILNRERSRRNKEAEQEVNRQFSNLRRRFRRLQRDTEEFMDELEGKGWNVGTKYGGKPFSVELTLQGVRPPKYDDHPDLDEARTFLIEQYSEALETIVTKRAEMLRQLTLNMLESDEAIEFFENMPTAENLLPPPPLVKQLQG